MRSYELMFVVQPTLEEEQLEALVERVKDTITSAEGTIIDINDMGKRRLAYKIGRYHDGHYFLITAEMTNATLDAIKRVLRLSEDVLRDMIIKLEPPKAVEEVESTEEGAAEESRPNERRGGGGRSHRRKVCLFCVERMDSIDYKDVALLRRFVNQRGRILPRRRTNSCAKHQRLLSAAIKRARFLALLPYAPSHVRGND